MAKRKSQPKTYPGVEEAIGYARDCLSGKVRVCGYVQISCERFLSDISKAVQHTSPWDWRPELAQFAMDFAGLMPNIKGPEAGKPLRLMPWQKFIFANLFGFCEKGTLFRRFRQGTVWVPRGNGKTTLAAPIALYTTFVESEGGAEGYAAAVTRDQARILFEAAQNMAKRSTDFLSTYGVGISANAIYQESSASKFSPIASDAKSLDGLNVHLAVCDEIASHKTSQVYDILLTAMGKRSQPLLLTISTATDNNTGIGKQIWDYLLRVLGEAQDDDRIFGVIYTIDENDDPWAEESWIKANPGWGQSVQPDGIRAIMRQAHNNPAQEAAAMTRHLNVWVGADAALFSIRAWRACTDHTLRLENFEGRECYIAVDLASKVDLAAIALVFPTRDGFNLRYSAFVECYLNEAAVLEARNPSYPGWAKDEYIRISQGNETDFAEIEERIIEFCKKFRVAAVLYDPWAATQLAQRLQAQRIPVVEFRATTQNVSEPTKELDAAMQAKRIEHDGNPVLEWAIGNVVGRYDARANVYPKRARDDHKIDPAIALIMGIAGALTMRPKRSIYEDRGLQSLEL